MNLIPKLRTKEEKKNFPVEAKPFPQQVAEKMEAIRNKSDEELQEIADSYRGEDYAMQQAALRTLRGRKNAQDTRTVEQQYQDAPDYVWH